MSFVTWRVWLFAILIFVFRVDDVVAGAESPLLATSSVFGAAIGAFVGALVLKGVYVALVRALETISRTIGLGS